mmetsp:Transcript_20596/g.41819  ORF Transcript_20596/g.41819 Transcript_20596/m.41819 type:complete len:93 (+) Transcript_20596:99-377(+)
MLLFLIFSYSRIYRGQKIQNKIESSYMTQRKRSYIFAYYLPRFEAIIDFRSSRTLTHTSLFFLFELLKFSHQFHDGKMKLVHILSTNLRNML